MKIYFIAAEMASLAQTGGLGDVIESLSRELAARGVQCCVILPKYAQIEEEQFKKGRSRIQFFLGDKVREAKVWQRRLDSGVEVLLLDLPDFFDRPFIYGEEGKDYPDNCARFLAFNRAALELVKKRKAKPDILHLHDWHSALIAFYLKSSYAQGSFFKNTRSVLTIHNLAHQGLFYAGCFELMGLEKHYYAPRYLEFHHRVNFLKAGLVSADAITTVSPSYAEESLTPEGGYGLDGVLRDRRADFYGILNGIDWKEWNPEQDAALPAHFSKSDLQGKAACKRTLQEEFHLTANPRIPIFASIGRFTYQKGVELILELIPRFLYEPVQWLILGSGDHHLEQEFLKLSSQYPEKIGVKVGFHPELAHKIQAGSDFFVMPSRYEPCGLTQLHALRYGTLPVAHAVGGLKDTIIDLQEEGSRATGFLFSPWNQEAFEGAVRRALAAFGDAALLKRLRQEAMSQDFSWDRSAMRYLEIYEKILANPPSEIPLGIQP